MFRSGQLSWPEYLAEERKEIEMATDYRGRKVVPCPLGTCDDGFHYVGPRRKVGPPCEDCGQTLPVRVIIWKASGGRYTVCAKCETAYVHASIPAGI
jgi:hypothetical protein